MSRFPTLFISHGSPTFAIEPGIAGPVLTALGKTLPRPKAILIVSPHWTTREPRVARSPWSVKGWMKCALSAAWMACVSCRSARRTRAGGAMRVEVFMVGPRLADQTCRRRCSRSHGEITFMNSSNSSSLISV